MLRESDGSKLGKKEKTLDDIRHFVKFHESIFISQGQNYSYSKCEALSKGQAIYLVPCPSPEGEAGFFPVKVKGATSEAGSQQAFRPTSENRMYGEYTKEVFF